MLRGHRQARHGWATTASAPLLGEGRKDASGDFTDGAGLSDDQAGMVMDFIAARRETGAATRRTAGATWSVRVGHIGDREALTELREHRRAFSRRKAMTPTASMIDPSVVRGLGYYTGPVFEAELTFEITDDKGRPQRFGSRRRRRPL